MPYVIQYTGFELRPRGRDYSYRVLAPKAEPREFTLTISNRAFEDRLVLYQDGAALCYQKLQKELLTETSESPLARHLEICAEHELRAVGRTRPRQLRRATPPRPQAILVTASTPAGPRKLPTHQMRR